MLQGSCPKIQCRTQQLFSRARSLAVRARRRSFRVVRFLQILCLGVLLSWFNFVLPPNKHHPLGFRICGLSVVRFSRVCHTACLPSVDLWRNLARFLSFNAGIKMTTVLDLCPLQVWALSSSSTSRCSWSTYTAASSNTTNGISTSARQRLETWRRGRGKDRSGVSWLKRNRSWYSSRTSESSSDSYPNHLFHARFHYIDFKCPLRRSHPCTGILHLPMMAKGGWQRSPWLQ